MDGDQSGGDRAVVAATDRDLSRTFRLRGSLIRPDAIPYDKIAQIEGHLHLSLHGRG